MKHDLAIAYHTYSQDILYDRTNYKFIHGKGHDMITTCGGKTYDPDEWVGIVLEYLRENDLLDLFTQVKDYVRSNFIFVKPRELNVWAADCVLHESYKHWSDFTYQERLKL